MSKRILVPVDGSDHAEAALSFVVENFPDATVVLLHVINPAEAGYNPEASVPSFSEDWYEQKRTNAYIPSESIIIYNELFCMWGPDDLQRRDDETDRVRLSAVSRDGHRLEVGGQERAAPLTGRTSTSNQKRAGTVAQRFYI